MTVLAFLSHLAFCTCLAGLSAVVVRVMMWARVMDRPDARKAHVRPTPKGGGVGVVVAFLLGVFVLYRYASFSRIGDPYFRGVIEGSIAIAVVAFVDDLLDWPFVVKFAAQIGAALLAIGSGLSIDLVSVPYFGDVPLGWAGPVVTLAWILFATNAMNFIDGLNGLAAGVGLVACAFLAAIAAGQNGWFVYFASLLLAAGLVGFLPFNYPRARIFLGDVGSQFLGFVLAVLGVAASRFQGIDLSFVTVPLLLSGVLFDVAFTLVRRAMARENLARAHRGHLYQVAQRAGMDARLVSAVHWGFTVAGGMCCLLFMAVPGALKPLALLLPLIMQLLWLLSVGVLARQAGLGKW